jgi:hypothetical protein
MKFIISLLFSFSVHSAPIFLYFEKDISYASHIKLILVREYKIPDYLIKTQNIDKCSKIKQRSKLDLCFTSDGDLKMVSVDRKFIDESLNFFRIP